jgi:arrestin-related trafficking adapter 4/5/7
VAYKIVLPQKNHIMGTSIPADFTLIPLKKGVEIGKIKMEVVEHMLLSCEQAGGRAQHSKETVIATMEAQMPPNAAREVTSEIEELGPEHLFDECYNFNLSLDLPRSLQSCRQSVETPNIKIVHKMRLFVNLLNPEGHTSQLVVKNNLHLFMSPNLPPGEDLSVSVDPDLLSATARQAEAMQTAPPTYGLHQLDALYRDIDPRGFQSTTASAIPTPFFSQSRNPSSEQLPISLDTVRRNGEGASPSQLHSRLSTLNVDPDYVRRRNRSPSYQSSGGNTPYSGAGDSSAGHSRHGSVEGYFAGVTSGDGEFDMDALVRTPSYSTAVRTPVRRTLHEDLPTYEAATSAPPSPAIRQIELNQPSPPGSLETLRETERNTRLNSRRASPVREAVILEEGPR